ncbi:hypothetical protein NDU88_006096 [Pleurodeles waltl]|uniref:Uncharacterized protein n=1 Tax=Pleurodeles waltl TaxID=8319 RepID=A0AAV7NP97_PLEWA|nr:hypothetical protein NDU88_006096 [Pleurodeles waltl]
MFWVCPGPVVSLREWIFNIAGVSIMDLQTKVFVVEPAHRALVAPPHPGEPPTAIIARLLNYNNRDCILRAARESERKIFENCKISIYPDYTNKVQTSRKGFMEVKVKLRAMNVSYMLLYPARLKVISGGKSNFFNRPEEVWRWAEMWDKAAPSRMEKTGLTVHYSSGPASPDWRSCGERRLEGTADQIVDIVASTTVEIQQDGTMAVVTPGSTDGLMGTMVPGAGVTPGGHLTCSLTLECRRHALLMEGLDLRERHLECFWGVCYMGGTVKL